MTKKQFIKMAKKRGFKVKVNDITKAKPLSEICGQLKYEENLQDIIDLIRCYRGDY